MAKILLIDEKKDIRDFMARFFHERNFEVSSASNRGDALAAVKKDRPDVVLLDAGIRNSGGIEILRHITGEGKNIKVIMISSVDDAEIKEKAKQLGAAGCLTRPLALNELVDAVLSNIGKKKGFFRLKRNRGKCAI